MRAKEREGGQTIHVARTSNSYGYDIENRRGGYTLRIEVKGAVESTSDGFYITRNEVAQARRHGSEWILVQIIFNSGLALRDELAIDDIRAVRSLSTSYVR